MRTNAIVAVALVAVLTLSGCFGGSKGSGGSTSDTDTSTSPQTNSTGDGNLTGNHTNQPPTASFIASLVNGSAPLNITFNITVTDPEGGDLNWTMSFGDNTTLNGTVTVNATDDGNMTEATNSTSGGNATSGTNSTNGTSLALPTFSLQHLYNSTGNFTVIFLVSDAEGLNATFNATIQVVGGAAAGPVPVVIALATTLPCPDCYYAPPHSKVCGDFTTGQGRGTRCDWKALLPAYAGRSFLLKGGSDPGIEFFNTCSSGGTATSVKWQDVTAATEAGTVPAGALCVVVYEFESDSNTFVLTLT